MPCGESQLHMELERRKNVQFRRLGCSASNGQGVQCRRNIHSGVLCNLNIYDNISERFLSKGRDAKTSFRETI